MRFRCGATSADQATTRTQAARGEGDRVGRNREAGALGAAAAAAADVELRRIRLQEAPPSSRFPPPFRSQNTGPRSPHACGGAGGGDAEPRAAPARAGGGSAGAATAPGGSHARPRLFFNLILTYLGLFSFPHALTPQSKQPARARCAVRPQPQLPRDPGPCGSSCGAALAAQP